MKKIHWATFSTTEVDNDSNRVKLENVSEKILEVTVVDKNGNEIKRHTDLSRSEHKILITMKFQWETTKWHDTSSTNIEYFIKKADNCWEVNKEKNIITVKPGKKAEFERVRKEMHKNLFEKEFDDKIDIAKQEVATNTDMEYIILKNGREGYKVDIYKGNDNREFDWEQVEIKPQFYQNKQADFDNVFTIEYQEEKKPQLTTSWIIFFATLFVVIVLGIVFRKKIWRWIKGEREQEKKVKEQLDIF